MDNDAKRGGGDGVQGSDEDIVQKLKDQSPEALSLCIQRFGPSVTALVRRILAGVASSEDIEECVSDVFVTAWRQADKYDADRGSVRTWLLILTKFQALELRRKLTRQPPVIDDTALCAVPGDGQEPVVDAVLSRERQVELIACIRNMETGLRTVFLRRYLLHQSPYEIAKELGLTRSAVDNRLWRGRLWLRQQLEKLEKGGGSHGFGITT